MKYLENSICTFTPLFPINYSSKKNIISTVFFKMPDSGYKPFTKYLNGISFLASVSKKKLPDFAIRLFIDNSIYKDNRIMNYLNKIPNLELVHFDCPNYKVNDFHRGTFGTLIRFFPMFNFPNNDAIHVLVTDIDWDDENDVEERFKIKVYEILKQHNDLENLHVFIDGSLNHKGFQYTYLPYLNTIVPKIIAYFIINCVKINHKIIVNFIEQVNKTNTIYSDYFNNLNFLEKKSKNRRFVYGIDEYFLNNVMVPFLDKNKLEFGAKIKYTITNEFFYMIYEGTKEYRKFVQKNKSTKKQKELLKKMFDFVLDGIDNYKFKNLKHAFDLMDKYTYEEHIKNKLTNNQKTIFTRLLLFFNYIRKNNIKLIEPIKLNFILDELKDTISIEKFKFYYSNKKPIIFKEVKLEINK